MYYVKQMKEEAEIYLGESFMNKYVKDAYYDCILVTCDGNMWYFYKNLARKPREVMFIDNTSPMIAKAQIDYCKANRKQYVEKAEDQEAIKSWIKQDNVAYAISINSISGEEAEKIEAGNKGQQHWGEIVKKTPNAIVKYHNAMNDIRFTGFNESDYDVFMTLLSFIKNKETETIILTFSQLKEVMGCNITAIDTFVDKLDHMYDRLGSVKCRIESNDKIVRFTVFPTYTIDRENQTLAVQVHESFKHLFNHIQSNFTIFEISEFIRLVGKYNKILYMHLKQYKNGDGWWYVSVEDFRAIMDIPDTYTNRDVMSKVIKPCVAELGQCFPSLECTPIYAKRKGKPVEAYKFTFTPQSRMLGQQRFTDNESLADYTQANMSAVEKKEEAFINATKTPKSKNKFNNFEQNEYDYEALEKAIIAN